jgi:lipopolysaccharide biosynthesis glycosyltransferase
MPAPVFIGSGEASLLERKVLIYSLRRNSRYPVDIRVFNGTHNALEREGQEPAAVPMSLKIKYQNVTEFSNYRFLIPKLCNFEGRAIWLDSDMICLGDINDLFVSPMEEYDLLAKAESYGSAQSKQWGLSVTLFDCSRCRFDLELYFDEIARGSYTYADLHQMTPRFLQHHPFRIGPLDPSWNQFDAFDGSTRLIHYTNLYTQPWKYRGHPYGDLWFQYLEEARKEGYVTDRDIELTLVRSFARRDLLEGNAWTIPAYLRRIAHDVRTELKRRRTARR